MDADAIRRGLGVVIIVTWPPTLVFWFVVHPAVALWRRVGHRLTYSVVTLAMIAVGAVGYRLRDVLLGRDLGFAPVLIVPAALSYAGAIAVYLQRRRHLTPAILTGVRELALEDAGELLTEGVYSRMRHPRYVELSLATFALALVVNHVGIYALYVAFLAGLYAVILLEERELRDRFGERYAAYEARVPRFIPRSS